MISRLHRRGYTAARPARGFTLLEVLIALLVLAFGLLGFALLQTMNLRFTQSANHRTQATNLAYDLLDQIRANRLQAREYTAITPGTFAGETGVGCAQKALGTGITVQKSMERWRCQVVATLGQGANATVDYDDDDNELSVNVTWNDERWTAGGEKSFILVTRL